MKFVDVLNEQKKLTIVPNVDSEFNKLKIKEDIDEAKMDKFKQWLLLDEGGGPKGGSARYGSHIGRTPGLKAGSKASEELKRKFSINKKLDDFSKLLDVNNIDKSVKDFSNAIKKNFKINKKFETSLEDIVKKGIERAIKNGYKKTGDVLLSIKIVAKDMGYDVIKYIRSVK